MLIETKDTIGACIAIRNSMLMCIECWQTMCPSECTSHIYYINIIYTCAISCIHEEGKPMSAAWSLEDFHKNHNIAPCGWKWSRSHYLPLMIRSVEASTSIPSVVYIRWWKLRKKHFQIPRQLCKLCSLPKDCSEVEQEVTDSFFGSLGE